MADERLEADIARLRQQKRSTRPADLHRILTLTHAGFTRRYGKGDHWIYEHRHLETSLIIDPRNPVKLVYINMAIKALTELLND